MELMKPAKLREMIKYANASMDTNTMDTDAQSMLVAIWMKLINVQHMPLARKMNLETSNASAIMDTHVKDYFARPLPNRVSGRNGYYWQV